MWMGPCAVSVPRGSGAELELMLAGSSLPRSMLAAGSLVGKGEKGYTRAKCEQQFLCSLVVPTLLGLVGPKVLEQNSDGWVQTHSTPYKCTLPLLTHAPLHWHFYPTGEQSWRKVCWSSPWGRWPCMCYNPGTLVRAPDLASLANL